MAALKTANALPPGGYDWRKKLPIRWVLWLNAKFPNCKLEIERVFINGDDYMVFFNTQHENISGRWYRSTSFPRVSTDWDDRYHGA